MSEFVQLKSPYKVSDLNLDRLATKAHQRKNKLIVKIYYKPSRKHHTDFLIQTPEILLKKTIKYNNKGYYELELPFLGKKHNQIEKYENFMNDLENKIIDIIKDHKEWFPNKNIRFKSIIRYPDSKNDLHKSIRLKVDSNTLITKKNNNIDLNNLKKDYYVKCILKISSIYIKDTFSTINISPKLIDLRDQIEELSFAPESESESSIDSQDLSTTSEEDNNNLPTKENNPDLEENIEPVKTIESSTMDIPSEIRDNCGTKDMFKENLNIDDNDDNDDDDEDEDDKNEDGNKSVEELEGNEIRNDNISNSDEKKNEVLLNNDDTDTSIISNINNSENYIESYNTNQNYEIKEIKFNSEESNSSDYSEEINQNEISQFESELLAKS